MKPPSAVRNAAEIDENEPRRPVRFDTPYGWRAFRIAFGAITGLVFGFTVAMVFVSWLLLELSETYYKMLWRSLLGG